ncbi:MAG: 2-oxoacid:acceptor oxidoreductase family protein [Bilophila wadsworthia]
MHPQSPGLGLRAKARRGQGACRKCGRCHICPGIEDSEDGTPRWNNLSFRLRVLHARLSPDVPVQGPFRRGLQHGNGSRNCHASPCSRGHRRSSRRFLPASSRLSLAIRGVGGQGNLFFGKVLAQVAFLAGYDDRNILKGETHGMAQMGGPVISTFGCGEVFSPALVPGPPTS